MRFDVIGGATVHDIITHARAEIVEDVRRAYLMHDRGETVNPPSGFLRYPDRPRARIIALPAYVGGEYEVAGIKWVASEPENRKRRLPRASAVLVLNDVETGFPFACLEASHINVARTAASAVLAAEALAGGRRADRVAVIGAGTIARGILDFLITTRWSVGDVVVHDSDPDAADALARHVKALGVPVAAVGPAASAIDGSDLVVLTTTATEPHITNPDAFTPRQNVLNISLRDIGPEIVVASHNIVDDVDHCLTASTSVHLAEQRYGHRDFIDGTLAQLLLGEIELSDGKPRVFSPFGLGILDLVVGHRVFRTAVERGLAQEIPGFFEHDEGEL